MRADLMRAVPACLVALVYCAASSAVIMLNKYLISVVGFALPMSLSLIGMLFGLAVSSAILALTSWVPRTTDLAAAVCDVRRALPIGVLTAIALCTGNYAYLDLSVSFVQMLKASTPVIVMALMSLAGLETPSLPMVGSVLIIGAGTLISAAGEVRFAWRGFCFMTTSQVWRRSSTLTLTLTLSGLLHDDLAGVEALPNFNPNPNHNPNSSAS